MIPIVAKDRESFLAICGYFNINPSQASFVEYKRELKRVFKKPRVHFKEQRDDRNFNYQTSDWCCYERA